MKSSYADASKLFKVLVLGGLSMAMPACSGGSTGTDAGTDAASAVDAAKDQSAPNDAATTQDSGGCTDPNGPPDCNHGTCGW